MPQEEGGLKGLYYKISDKAWAFAEWLEAKGMPLASFCDKHHIHPLLIMSVVVLGLLILALMALGTGVAYGNLAVTVTSSNAPVDGATVSYNFAGQSVTNTTNALGKTSLKFPIGVETTVSASKTGFKEASVKKKLDTETGSVALSLERKVGGLKVNIDAGDMELPTGAYVAVSGTGVSKQNNVVGDSVTFNDLPAGVEVTVYLHVDSQNIPSSGEKVTIVEGKTSEITIEVTENSLSTSLDVKVTDSSYQNVEASVQLFNWRTSASMDGPKSTYNGLVTFNDIPLGTSVYVTIQPSNSQYSDYNGKTDGVQFDVTRDGLVYEVVLDTIGKVEVCVYDEDGLSLGTGTVRIKETTGQPHCTKTLDGACVSCFGIPEGALVYPQVTATGYQAYDDKTVAKRVDYSTVTHFDVNMIPLGESGTVNVYAHVSDCDTGEAIDGIKVKVIDQSSENVLKEGNTRCDYEGEMQHCGNVLARVQNGRAVYAVTFDEDYQLARSDSAAASAGLVLDIETCEADDDNSGDLEVCVYKDGDPYKKADLELYDSEDYMIWSSDTDDDEDNEDNCHTFTNIPDGEEVYVKATNIGGSSEVSDSVVITAGEVASISVYKGTPPVILAKGDVEVCTYDKETERGIIATVKLYDANTDQKITEGQTAASGCKLFNEVTAERNDGGTAVPREIYIVAEKTGYGTYNGESEDEILTMVPDGKLTAKVNLSEAFDICVVLKSSDTDLPMQGDITLYFDDNATSPIETKTTDLSGLATFSQAQKDYYYFKVREIYTLYDPLPLYTFPKADVSGGNCGVIRLYDLASLCTLGLEVLDGDEVNVIKGQQAAVPIRILKDGVRADSSITNEGASGTKQTVILDDGTSANLTFKISGKFQPFTLTYGYSEYSSDPEILLGFSPGNVGDYKGLLEATQGQECTRQAAFDLTVYEEQLMVSVDQVTFDPVMSNSVTFCIYVTDQDSEKVTDAQVVLAVDEMDEWAQTATRTAVYDEVKQCYKGALTASLVKKDTSGDYVAGDYLFSVAAKRADITKIVQPTATITVTELCGNGEIDQGEQCDTADDTCQTGYSCSDECKCVEVQCGSLLVSADTATLSIGSGLGSGFCVRVEDECGDVTTAQVAGKFYSSDGWASDTTVNTGYDLARDCYYIPVSQNLVAMQAGSNVNQMLGSKIVRIVATKGKTTGQTTTTVSVTCGCDKERWCEVACPCDKKCLEGGGGSLNLANCLILAGQQGYYPQGYTAPTYYTGGATAGGGYASGIGMTGPGGGLSVGSTGTIGITGAGGGGIGFNWDACKNLFGWGEDSSTGATVKSYVHVRDYQSVIKDTTDCKAMSDYLKAKGLTNFKYFYVDKGGNGAGGDGETCCTDSMGIKECKWDNFYKLVSSNPGQVTYVDILKFESKDQLSDYGLGAKLIGRSKNTVLYDGVQKLYGHGAVFSVYGSKVRGGQGKDQIVFGYLGDTVKFSDALSQVWREAGAGLPMVIKYLSTATEADKTITLANPGLEGLKGAVLSSDEVESAGVNSAVFNEVGAGTKLYVITDYETVKAGGVIGQVANAISGSGYPKFEEFEKGSLGYCSNGNPTEWQEKVVMLMARASDKVYFVGTKSANIKNDLCKVSSGSSAASGAAIGPGGETVSPQKITRSTYTPTDMRRIAYGKARDDSKYLLLFGTRELQTDIINRFYTDAKTLTSKVYPYEDKYGVVPAAEFSEKQVCTPPRGQYTLDTELVGAIGQLVTANYPDNFVLSNRLIDCVYLGKGMATPKGQIRAKITVTDPAKKAAGADIKNLLAIYIKRGDAAPSQYPLKETENVESISSNVDTGIFDVRIKDIDLDQKKGDLTVWAVLKKGAEVCVSSKEVQIKVSEMFGGVDKVIELVDFTKACNLGTNTDRVYTLKGVVTDTFNAPLVSVVVAACRDKDCQTTLGESTVKKNDGRFELPSISTVPGPVYLKASYGSLATTPKEFFVPAEAGTVDNLNLKFEDAAFIAIGGTLLGSDDNAVKMGTQVQLFKGAASGGFATLLQVSPSVSGSLYFGQVGDKGRFAAAGLLKASETYKFRLGAGDIIARTSKGGTTEATITMPANLGQPTALTLTSNTGNNIAYAESAPTDLSSKAIPVYSGLTIYSTEKGVAPDQGKTAGGSTTTGSDDPLKSLRGKNFNRPDLYMGAGTKDFTKIIAARDNPVLTEALSQIKMTVGEIDHYVDDSSEVTVYIGGSPSPTVEVEYDDVELIYTATLTMSGASIEAQVKVSGSVSDHCEYNGGETCRFNVAVLFT